MSSPTNATPPGTERRSSARAYVSLRVLVAGVNKGRDEYPVEGSLHDISTGGLRLRCSKCVRTGDEVLFLITTPAQRGPGVRKRYLQALGTILRAEALPGGGCDMAAQFSRPLWDSDMVER